MQIFYTATNNGDGSASVVFFDNPRWIELLEEHDPETYGGGEGGGYFEVEGVIKGMHIMTEEEVREIIVDFLGLDWETANAAIA